MRVREQGKRPQVTYRFNIKLILSQLKSKESTKEPYVKMQRDWKSRLGREYHREKAKRTSYNIKPGVHVKEVDLSTRVPTFKEGEGLLPFGLEIRDLEQNKK